MPWPATPGGSGCDGRLDSQRSASHGTPVSGGSKVPPGAGGFLRGVGDVIAGFGVLLREPKQRRRAVIPILLTLLAYAGALAGVAFGAEPLLQLLWSEPAAGWTVERIGWVLVRWGLALGLFVGLCFLFTAVLEIIAGPFFDDMARLELDRRGMPRGDPGLWDGTVLEAARAILMALPLLLFGVAALIPALTIPAGVLGTGWAWFGLGAGAVNPSLVQTGRGMRARLAFTRAHFGWVLGVGALIGAALLIPVVGWVALPAGVIGAARRVPPGPAAAVASDPEAADEPTTSGPKRRNSA